MRREQRWLSEGTCAVALMVPGGGGGSECGRRVATSKAVVLEWAAVVQVQCRHEQMHRIAVRIARRIVRAQRSMHEACGVHGPPKDKVGLE